MKNRVLVAGLLALLCAAPCARADEPPAPKEPKDSAEGPPWAVGLGYGVVYIDGQGDGYFGVNIRRRVGGRGGDDEKDAQGRSGDEKTGFRMGRQREGIRAFVEAEYGRFSREADRRKDTDSMLGLNVIGVVPARSVDVFLGIGFGVHFFDGEPALPADEDATRIGGNAQFGVEVYVTDKVGIFGVGRVDFIEGERLGQQSKVWAGLRVHF